MDDAASKQDARNEQRAKMFLVASLKTAGFSCDCRVRNVSPHGALIESNANLSTSSTVILSRGQSSIAGEVVWSRDNYCGLKFPASVDVLSWASDGVEKLARPTGLIKRDNPQSQTSPTAAEDEIVSERLKARLAEEIELVARTIDLVSDVLANDGFLRLKHAIPLQQLVMSKQTLCEISVLMREADAVSSIRAHSSGPLRGRLLRV